MVIWDWMTNPPSPCGYSTSTSLSNHLQREIACSYGKQNNKTLMTLQFLMSFMFIQLICKELPPQPFQISQAFSAWRWSMLSPLEVSAPLSLPAFMKAVSSGL